MNKAEQYQQALELATLLHDSEEQSGKCLGNNGFVYSVVKGRYYIPQQQ